MYDPVYTNTDEYTEHKTRTPTNPVREPLRTSTSWRQVPAASVRELLLPRTPQWYPSAARITVASYARPSYRSSVATVSTATPAITLHLGDLLQVRSLLYPRLTCELPSRVKICQFFFFPSLSTRGSKPITSCGNPLEKHWGCFFF